MSSAAGTPPTGAGTPATDAGPAPRTPFSAEQRLLATGMVLSVMLVAFEVTAVITALPTITDELGGDSLYGVSLAIYTLANLAALVVAGEMSDKRGPAVPFVVCVLTLVIGLVVAAAAPAMIWIVVGRALQGAGTGGFSPIAYMLVKRAFPHDRQPMMYAYLSAGWVLPSLFAPALSGWVTDEFGWPWVFLGLVPFALAVGVLAVRPMLRYGPVPFDRVGSRIPAALAAAVGVGALVTGLQFANPYAAVGTSIAGIAVAVPAIRRLFPPGVHAARRGLPAIIACRVLATATFLGADSFIPLAADRIHGASPTVQGFVIIGAALTWTLGQWVRAHRPPTDQARAVQVGFAVMLLGLGLVAPVLWSGWPLIAVFLAWAVGGLGMGLLYNPATVAAMSYAVDGREGEVSSQVTLADAVGFSLMGGIGGATVAIADRTSWSLAGAVGTNLGIAALLAALGIVAARRVRPFA
ncbi:MAG: MFS transporter [Actinomycetota bacterium]|nr:MFS transporter [Actinomycetota bacterium]